MKSITCLLLILFAGGLVAQPLDGLMVQEGRVTQINGSTGAWPVNLPLVTYSLHSSE